MRVLVALITIGVTIYAFVDCLRSGDHEVRNLPRPLWLLITLVPLVGGLAWLTFGRPSSWQPVPRAGRPLAPDDDPEFLQSLDRSFRERRRQAAEEARRRRRAEEARRQAEEEASRREREPRRGPGRSGGRGGGKPGPSGTGPDGQPDGATPSPSNGPAPSPGPEGEDRSGQP